MEIPDSFSFSPDSLQGRARLRLTREIILHHELILGILIPSISNAILAIEEEEPEKAEAIKAYAEKLFKACIG